MGCDIHIYTEGKLDGKWTHLDELTSVDEYEGEPPYKNYSEIYNSRSYNLFSILADVRNGYGFAGFTTGEGFSPISKPKGLPEDVTESVKEKSDSWDCDGHSHSYLSLKELLDYDWEQTTINQGMLTKDEFDRLMDNDWWKEKTTGPDKEGFYWLPKAPNHYSSMISGSVEVVSFKYKTTYREAAEYFYKQVMSQLKRLAILAGGPENVRIVFWFDN